MSWWYSKTAEQKMKKLVRSFNSLNEEEIRLIDEEIATIDREIELNKELIAIHRRRQYLLAIPLGIVLFQLVIRK